MLITILQNNLYNKLSNNRNSNLFLYKPKASIVLFDNNHNKYITNSNDLIITDLTTTNDNNYKVILIDSNGDMHYCYIDKNDLGKKLDEIHIDDFNINNSNIKEVFAHSGSNLRKDYFVDEDNVIDGLKSGSDVLTANYTYNNKDDVNSWDKSIAVIDDKLVSGYMSDNYLLDKDTIDDNIRRFIVNTGNSSILLKLRDSASINGNIITTLDNGTDVFTYQTYLDECNNSSEDSSGRKWLKVYTLSNDVGYVAYDYLEQINENKDIPEENEDTKEKEEISNTNLDGDEISIDFASEGSKDGYLVIDVNSDAITSSQLENLLKQDVAYDTSSSSAIYGVAYPIQVTTRPKAVIIKMGATGYANPFSIIDISKYQSKVNDLADVCEKYDIPYGFYYFSQATNNNEADDEKDYIVKMYQSLGGRNYNILPLYLDVETNGNRYRNSLHGDITNVVNHEASELRKELNRDIAIYSEHNALNSIINYDNLDSEVKDDIWIVDAGPLHSSDVQKIENSVKLRQFGLDVAVDSNNDNVITQDDARVDFNLMDSDYYKSKVR